MNKKHQPFVSKVRTKNKYFKQIKKRMIRSKDKAIVESHFTYCASNLFFMTQTDMDRIQKLQNKCLRNILNVNKYGSSNEMIRKIINGETPKYLTEKIKFKRENHSRLLRNSK